MLAWTAVSVLGLNGQVHFLCQDETRIGLKTISGRKLTATDIKPSGKVQWQFKATDLYGVVEPATGAHFFYEFTHRNSACFQVFLNLVSQQGQHSHPVGGSSRGTQSQAAQDTAQHHPDVPAVTFTGNQPNRASLAAFQVGVAMETAKELG